ncbi:hypothetical protein pipiens_010748 [Culex pipiens pipiens]|uniref:Uncharacterized protein n=1 Tax=Culex pipiens pipiens TaxID=38569 RepID=A0ABD1D9J0_CULPP
MQLLEGEAAGQPLAPANKNHVSLTADCNRRTRTTSRWPTTRTGEQERPAGQPRALANKNHVPLATDRNCRTSTTCRWTLTAVAIETTHRHAGEPPKNQDGSPRHSAAAEPNVIRREPGRPTTTRRRTKQAGHDE